MLALVRLGRYDRLFRGTDELSGVPSPQLTVLSALLGVERHMGRGLWLGLQVPTGLVLLTPANTNDKQHLAGTGDVEVTLRQQVRASGRAPRLSLSAGLSLPTGTTSLLGDADDTAPLELISIGQNAFGLRVGADLMWPVHARVGLMAGAGARTPLQRNSGGMRFGASARWHAGVIAQPVRRLALGARVMGSHRGRSNELEQGIAINSGGHWVDLALTASVSLGERANLELTGELPLWRDVRGTQTTARFGFITAVSVRLGARVEPEPEPTLYAKEDGDIRDVGVGGKSFVLAEALAPGKITVVDYWAEWCAPCHVITQRLREITKVNPDVAVRRAEVPEFSMPVGQEHLPGIDVLPVVRVYGRDGALLRELIGTTPDEVIGAVYDALAGP